MPKCAHNEENVAATEELTLGQEDRHKLVVNMSDSNPL